MAVTAGPYTNTVVLLGTAGLDFTTDTFNVLLADSSYAIDPETDTFLDDLTGEISDAGYTAGGETLTGVSWTFDSGDAQGVFAADEVEWASIDTDVRYAVVYKDTGSSATSPLVLWIDLGVDENPGGALFRLVWADGVLVLAIGG